MEIGVSKSPWGRGAPAPRIADYSAIQKAQQSISWGRGAPAPRIVDYSTIQKAAAGATPTPGKSYPRESELSSRFNVK